MSCSNRRTLTRPLLVVAVVVVMLTQVLGTTTASADALPPASPVGALPFDSSSGGSWVHVDPSTGDPSAVLSKECNDNQPVYRVRWFSYSPSTTTTIVAQGIMETILGRDHYGVDSGAAVLSSNLDVIDCNRAEAGSGLVGARAVASAGPVRVLAGTTVYVAQFVVANPAPGDFDCDILCYDVNEELSVQVAGNPPVNDDQADASLVTSFPATLTADTTLATGDTGYSNYVCSTEVTAFVRTVWWTFKPLASGTIHPVGSDVALAELTPDGPHFLENDCGSEPFSVTAGKTYLLEAGVGLFDRQDAVGAGGPVTVTIDDTLPLARPDLVVTSVSAAPSNARTGDPVTFRATVKNQGTIATPSHVPVGVGFKVDGSNATWSDSFDGGLAPGGSVTLTANAGVARSSAWVARGGTHTVVATVDDVNRIQGETDETNNSRSLPVTVAAGPARPDLVVTGVSWTPAHPTPGTPVRFSATVKNQGDAPTPSGTVDGVSFLVDGGHATWSDTSTASLAPGASTTLVADGGTGGASTWAATGGAHTVRAMVDDVNRIKPESDESNNTRSVPLDVGLPPSLPDLRVTAVRWTPTSPAKGAPLRFTATVKNVGTRSTPPGKVVGVSFRPNGATSGATYSDTWTTPVPPGGSVTLTANGGGNGGLWTPSSAQTVPVSAVVDDINRIVESDESDNTLVAAVAVG